MPLEELPQQDIEVGYHLKPSAWGKGYATETAAALLEFAFEETALDRVLAVTGLSNHASQNVLRKAGLKDTGLRRAYGERLPGFEITTSEWLAAQ